MQALPLASLIPFFFCTVTVSLCLKIPALTSHNAHVGSRTVHSVERWIPSSKFDFDICSRMPEYLVPKHHQIRSPLLNFLTRFGTTNLSRTGRPFFKQTWLQSTSPHSLFSPFFKPQSIPLVLSLPVLHLSSSFRACPGSCATRKDISLIMRQRVQLYISQSLVSLLLASRVPASQVIRCVTYHERERSGIKSIMEALRIVAKRES